MIRPELDSTISCFLYNESSLIEQVGVERNRLFWLYKITLSEKLRLELDENPLDYPFVRYYVNHNWGMCELSTTLTQHQIRMMNEEEIKMPISILIYLLLYYPINTNSYGSYVKLVRDTTRRIIEAYTVYQDEVVEMVLYFDSILGHFTEELVG
ncbi:MAG: hypothetical protein ABIM99_01105 [Candidatus Dojkabacteria bacterium]